MKLSTKLVMLMGTALLGVVLMAATALLTMCNALVESRREEIVSLLTKAEHLVNAFRDQEKRGTMTHDQAIKSAEQALTGLNANADSYFWAHSWTHSSEGSITGTILVHPNAKFVGTVTKGNEATSGLPENEMSRLARGQSHFALVDGLAKRRPDAEPAPKLQGVVLISDWDWWIGTGFFYDEINATFVRAVIMLGLISLLIAVMVGAIAWAVLRSVKHTLGGEPAYPMRVATEIAKGNLNVQFDAEPPEPGTLLAALGDMRWRLAAMISEIQSASQSIAVGSGEIAQGNLNLSQRTEEQAASLQETAASMEQLR